MISTARRCHMRTHARVPCPSVCPFFLPSANVGAPTYTVREARKTTLLKRLTGDPFPATACPDSVDSQGGFDRRR